MNFLSRLFRVLYIHCTFEGNVTGEASNFPIHNILEMFIAHDILIAWWQNYLQRYQIHNVFASYFQQKLWSLNNTQVWVQDRKNNVNITERCT